jgi:integrase
MASLFKDPETKGAWVIQFVDGNGKRPKIRLGKMPKKVAGTFLSHVEELISCQLLRHSPSVETSAWLDGLHDTMHDKLSKVGLVVVRTKRTLGEIWEDFRKQKSGVKDSTLDVYDYAEQRFFAFFDRTTDVRKLTLERLIEWKTFLLTDYRSPRTDKPLVEATVAGAITKVKAVFNWAKKLEMVSSSPLDGLGRGSFVNEDKDYEVTMDMCCRLLLACPCQEWRTIIALARIGGLRQCEILRLRWADVDWEKGRFTVRSPKTERYKGKERRVVPLFPELRVELERLYTQESNKGKDFVINLSTNREGANLRTQFLRIVEKAGLEPFPRPFDNMRASRSTEIYNDFNPIVESEWVGHSRKVAERCYVRTREEDFERAAGLGMQEMKKTYNL